MPVEVIVTWPIGFEKEADKIYAEIGRVLQILLPCSKLVFADLEGVRLSISEEYLPEIRRLSRTLKYVEVEIE